jgi:hypothetical protein
MYFDRFDIVKAYYLYFNHYYSGMYCPKYARLGHIITVLEFRPSPMLSYENLSENGQAIYNNLEQNYKDKPERK